jgi:hypothetical protein
MRRPNDCGYANSPFAVHRSETGPHREPDLATLLRICGVLGASPNDLLGMGKVQAQPTKRRRLIARLVAAANSLESDDLALAIEQGESLARHRRARGSLDVPSSRSGSAGSLANVADRWDAPTLCPRELLSVLCRSARWRAVRSEGLGALPKATATVACCRRSCVRNIGTSHRRGSHILIHSI